MRCSDYELYSSMVNRERPVEQELMALKLFIRHLKDTLNEYEDRDTTLKLLRKQYERMKELEQIIKKQRIERDFT
jgi:cell shape-determining protein MreC